MLALLSDIIQQGGAECQLDIMEKMNAFLSALRTHSIHPLAGSYQIAQLSLQLQPQLVLEEFIFGRLLESMTGQRVVFPGKANHLSSLQICTLQMPMSGCRWSVANNNSGMLSGVRSVEESIITWIPGLCADIRSLTILTSDTVTPPTIYKIRRG